MRVLGGAGGEAAESVAVGDDGLVYVAGWTRGPFMGEPAAPKNPQAVVVALSPSGVARSRLVFGDEDVNFARDISAAPGAVYVAGQLELGGDPVPNYPHTTDLFVVRVLWTASDGVAP